MGGLADALAAAGATVTVFADAHPAADDDNDDNADGVTVRRFGGIKFFRRRRKGRAAARIVSSAAFAHVFCDSWKSLEHLPPLPAPAPAVTVFAHGSEYPPAPAAEKLRRITAALAKANRVFAVSAATRARMGECGVDVSRARVWHPAIASPAIPGDGEREWAAKLWGDSSPRLLTVGRLSARKGTDEFLRAAAALVAGGFPSLRCVVAGEGEEGEKLRGLAARLGLGGAAVFAGTVGDAQKSALYESADVFVLPARAEGGDMEGFGLVFLEAAFWGLPAVAGRSGGAAEAVEDGKTGLLCEGDRESVRRALLRMLSDESLRREMSARARKKAQRFLWSERLPLLFAPDACQGN